MNKKNISAKPRAALPAPLSPLGAAIQNGREITEEERGLMRSMDEAASKIRSMKTDVSTALLFLDVRERGFFRVEILTRLPDYISCVQERIGKDHPDQRCYLDNVNSAQYDNLVGAVENYLDRLMATYPTASLEIFKAKYTFCIYAETVSHRGWGYSFGVGGLNEFIDAASAILAANVAKAKSYPTELDDFFETVREELPKLRKNGDIQDTVIEVMNDPKFGYVFSQYGSEKGHVTLLRHFRTWRSRKYPGEIRPKAKAKTKHKR